VDVNVQVSGGEQLWQLTVKHSPVGTTLVAPDGRFLSANQALCDMLGYTEDEIRARTFQQITHPDDLAEDLALVEETLAGRRSSYRLRKRYLHADGHVVHGDLSVALLRTPDGTPIHFISQILDVTEAQEYAERLTETSQALDRERRYLEAVLDSVDVGVAVLDPERDYVVINRRLKQYVALAEPHGAEGKHGEGRDLFHEDGTRLEPDELPSVRAARGEEFDDLILWVGADPLTQRALSVSARSVRGAGGEFSGAVLGYADVTELVRALTAKDHFVATVSHELRTPLTSVLGHLELMAESPHLPHELSDRVRVVQRNAVRLRELVADLLLVAQMTDTRLELNRMSVDLADLVVEAVEALRPAAQGAGLSLDVDVPETPVVAKVDASRLRQVLDNLLGNAVKYTEPGGSVSVRLRRRVAAVELSVSDTGIGVAPDEVGQLFHRFFRGAQAARRQIPGAGLGLSIVRSIVEAHGGVVDVCSTPGEGSTFRIELPTVP
jgi:two-component system phosphate regulon sensor histidine kinase PhoR